MSALQDVPDTPAAPGAVTGKGRLKIHLERSKFVAYKTTKPYTYFLSLRLATPGSKEDRKQSRTQRISAENDVIWDENFYMNYSLSSSLRIRLYEVHAIKKNNICEMDALVSDWFKKSEITLPLLNVKRDVAHTLCLTVGEVQRESREEAEQVISQVTQQPLEASTRALVSKGDVAVTVGGAVISAVGTWGLLLEKVELVANVMEVVSEIHPYTRIAWKVISAGYELAKSQQQRDESVAELIGALHGAYEIAIGTNGLTRTSDAQHKAIIALTQQTINCGHFIVGYLKRGFWARAVRGAASSIDQEIQEFRAQFSRLQDNLTTHGVINIQRDVDIIMGTTQRIEDTVTLFNMPYTRTASLLGRKTCLPGTRTDILSQLLDWIHLSGDDGPRVLLLTGVAGVGKSSIASTVARSFSEMHRLGASYGFDQNDPTNHRPDMLFPTLARHLADSYSSFKHALVQQNGAATFGASELDAQFDNLLKNPLERLGGRISGPLVIVIDALDESATRSNRGKLLSIIARRFVELPPNFFLLLTSRPEQDIMRVFENKKHVLCRSLETTGSVKILQDIAAFVASKLVDVADEPLTIFTARHHLEISRKSEGLFQWAVVVCSSIVQGDNPGLPPTDNEMLKSYHNSVSLSSGALDELYTSVLLRILPEPSEKDKLLARMLGLVMTSYEPLSTCSLFELLQLSEEEKASSRIILQGLAALLMGVNSLTEPIRTLHSSFRDFILQIPHGERFCIDSEALHSEIVGGCLRVLCERLKFNICGLESSYNANKNVPGLAQRVGTSVSESLSYAARFWGRHLKPTAPSLRSDVAAKLAVLLDEKFLFWLELLSLLDAVNIAPAALGRARTHLSKHELQSVAKDCQRFVRTFGPAISRAAPHVYLSAYALAPAAALVRARSYSDKMQHLPMLSGLACNWSIVEKVILGHTGYVNSVSFSPNGRQILSASDDCTVRIWDSETGEAAQEPLKGHTAIVCCVAFSRDGRHIVSGSDDQSVRIWDTETGEIVNKPLVGHTSRVYSVAFSPDGRYVASGSQDRTVRIWDTETGDRVHKPLVGHTGWVRSVAFSPDGLRIVSGSDDRAVRIWDVKTGDILGIPLVGHSGRVRSVAFSPNGRHVVSGSHDRTVRVWDIETSKAVHEALGGHADWVTSVAFSPDGRRIVSGSSDRTVRIWDAETGNAICDALQGHTGDVYSVAFSLDGCRIVSGSSDQTMRIWDAEVAKPVDKSLKPHTDNVFTAGFSIGDSHDRTASNRDPMMNAAVGVPAGGHAGRVRSVAFSPDGRYIVSGSSDCTVRIWDADTGKTVKKPLEGHTNVVRSVSISPDSHRIVSGSDDCTVRVWDFQTGNALYEPLEGHADFVNSVAFSPDSRRIVSGSHDHTVLIWDTETGQAIHEPIKGHTDRVRSVAFSPNGHNIVSGSEDTTIRIWDTKTGESIGEPFRGHTDYVWSVAFSPDGRWIVSGSRDETVRVWDADTGEAVFEPFRDCVGWVSSVAFSQDGHRIVSGSDDCTVHIWEIETSEVVHQPLEGHTGFVSCVTFSPDGHRIASGSNDQTVRVWDVETRNAIYHRPEPHRNTETKPFLLGRKITLALPNFPCTNLTDSTSPLSHDVSSLLLAEDGWLQDASCEPPRLVLWVPPQARKGLYVLPALHVIAPYLVHCLDLGSFAHGARWIDCYQDSSM